MSGNPGRGLDSYFQIGRETAGNYGVKVAATKKYRIRSGASFRPDVDYIEPGVMYGQSVRPAPIAGMSVGRVRVASDLTYEGFTPWLDTAMGTGTFGSNGGSTSGAGPTYTHTIKQNTLFNSLSCEFVRGNIPASKCETIVGAKVRELTIAGEGAVGQGQLISIEMQLVGGAHAQNQNPTAVGSFTNGATNALFKHATFMDGTADSTAAGIVRAFRFALRNPLAERGFSSSSIAEPIYEDYLEAELMLRAEFATRTAFEKYTSVAAAAAGPNNPYVLLASGSQSIKLELFEAYIGQPFEPEVGGRGIITQEFVWKAIYNTSNATGAQITVVNTDASIWP